MLITRPGLQELPELTARNRVYLLSVPEDAAAAITDAEHAGFVESVLAWPEAEEWLPCTWLGGSLGFFSWGSLRIWHDRGSCIRRCRRSGDGQGL